MGGFFMTRGSRVYIAAVSAFIFAFGSGSRFSLKESAFFPAQAVHFEEEKTKIGELTVINGEGEIEISFRIAEFILELMD